MSQDQEYIREFVVECREGIDRIDNILVGMEKTPGERKGLDAVFRVLHTIKGNAGFLNFPKLGAIAHAGEALLSKLCGGKLKVSSEIADLLLRMVDTLRTVVAEIDAAGNEGPSDHASLIQELAHWVATSDQDSTSVASVKRDSSPPVQIAPAIPAEVRQPDDPELSLNKEARRADPDSTPEMFAVTSNIPSVPELLDRQAAEDLDRQEPSSAPADSAQPDDSWSMSAIGGKPAARELSTFLRVQIDQLDDLMNLVGELVLARNQILQITSHRPDDELTEPIQRLHRLTAALQDGVMRTRMQPVSNAWRKYPRIVRDLARNCGKQCEVELQGGDTELDKSMLEAIADPLVHLVRNAIDHGIEKPYLRRIKGKPETGRLLVRAFQESGQVHIEVSDDGAGLDLERIRRKAIEAGLVTPEKAQLVSESELQNSVFLPGFTTAERLTNLSGRGVGMDVVKSCVEQIGGTIELQTRKDFGTTIRLTVPLTLAIVPAIMVSCGLQRFAIPQINVVEMLRLRGEEIQQACDYFHQTPVLRLRGELLPMADLGVKLGISPLSVTRNSDTMDVVVLKTGTRRFALIVGAIGDAQEIVVKPLGALLARQTEYSGAALLGDGSIALIIDVLGIARSTGLLTTEQTLLSDSTTVREETPRLEEQVLLCRVDGNRQIALPLSNVVCLEKIPGTMIEYSATGLVMQYRGEILPLHELSQHSPDSLIARLPSDPVSVVVYRSAETQCGLIVEQIVDIAPRPASLNAVELKPGPNSKHHVVATGVVLGLVTDFLQVS